MGLTIHYEIKFNGTEKELVEKLNKIRNQCRDLPFEEVEDVKTVIITKEIEDTWNQLQRDTFWPNNSEENLAKRDRIMDELGVSTWDMIEFQSIRDFDEIEFPENPVLVSLNIWPGEGCDSSNLSFYSIRKNKFYCRSFCKTQYSENFVKDHLLVIKLMDMLKGEGFEVEVTDEGEYWQTRDIKVLAKNINESTEMLMSIFEGLKEQLESKSLKVESNIEHSKNFIKIN